MIIITISPSIPKLHITNLNPHPHRPSYLLPSLPRQSSQPGSHSLPIQRDDQPKEEKHDAENREGMLGDSMLDGAHEGYALLVNSQGHGLLLGGMIP